MENWWFGLVVWDSRATTNNPFHKGIPRNPNHQPKPPMKTPWLVEIELDIAEHWVTNTLPEIKEKHHPWKIGGYEMNFPFLGGGFTQIFLESSSRNLRKMISILTFAYFSGWVGSTTQPVLTFRMRLRRRPCQRGKSLMVKLKVFAKLIQELHFVL